MSLGTSRAEARPETGSQPDLPEGWDWARLAEVTVQVPNARPEAEPHREFRYVDISSISNESFSITGSKTFKGSAAPSRARRPIKPGDVLFSNVRTYLRNVAIVPRGLDIDLCSTGFTVLRSNGKVLPEYLFRYLLTNDFIDEVTEKQTGSNYPAVSDRVVLAERMPLPPLPEQRRIVAQVEALLGRVAAVRERLAAVPAIVKRFRQSVLTAACAGRLTKDWRNEQRVGEAAAASLARLRLSGTRAETRKRPPAQNMNGMRGGDFGLPEGWAWATFDDVCRDITVGHVGPMVNEYVQSGVPFLRSLNVKEFGFEPTDLKFVPPQFHKQLAKSALHPGDVVVVRSGNPGAACVIPENLPEANCSDLVIVRPTDALDPRYAVTFINSAYARRQIEAAKVGIAQGHFNIGSMRVTDLPLPPVAEQAEIVRRVEALFAVADAIDNRVRAATLRAKKLTQAVLAEAFRGELVLTEAELVRRVEREYEPT